MDSSIEESMSKSTGLASYIHQFVLFVVAVLRDVVGQTDD